MSEILAGWVGNDRVREAALATSAARDLIGRYVAGQDAAELLPVLHDLVDKGLLVSIEYLGVEVRHLADANRNEAEYLKLIDQLSAAGLASGAELSVRLGWLGLELGGLGQGHALASVRRVARAASNAGMLLMLDQTTEDLVERVLQIWRQLHQDWPTTGITIQANLHRSHRDMQEVAMPGNRVRLCKGAYSESRQVAFHSRHEVDLAFVRKLRTLVGSQATALVATHDPRLVSISEHLLRRTGRGPDSHEFQMLYGIRPLEQRRLADIGHPTRVYVPFGPGWWEYYIRRLADRPANVALFARSLLGKR